MNKVYIEPNSTQWLSLENLPNEQWNDIKGYEGLYQISDYGRVKSLGRVTTIVSKLGNKFTKTYYPKILKQNEIKSTKYVFVNLIDRKGVHKPKTIHRLVGLNFIENINNYPIILHKDDNKQNNYVNNLKWGTYRENIQSAYDNGLHDSRRRYVVKLNKNNDILYEYPSLSSAARDNKMYVSAISNCLAGRSETAGGFKWKYKNKKEDEYNGSKIQSK